MARDISTVLQCHSVSFTEMTEALRPYVQRQGHTSNPTSSSWQDHPTLEYQAAHSFKLLTASYCTPYSIFNVSLF